MKISKVKAAGIFRNYFAAVLCLLHLAFVPQVMASDRGQAKQACDAAFSPAIKYEKNEVTSGFYNIGRKPNSDGRYLNLDDGGQQLVMTNSPARDWLVTGVGVSLYQFSTCVDGLPQCLAVSADRGLYLETCEPEAYGRQVWWSIGIIGGPGAGGVVLGNDGFGHMDCFDVSDDGTPELGKCAVSGHPQSTWWFEPTAQGEQLTGNEINENAPAQDSADGVNIDFETFLCESGAKVDTFYDETSDAMIVRYAGEQHTLIPVISGSGAKFGGDNVPWGWWNKGNSGFIFGYGDNGEETDFIERCELSTSDDANATDLPDAERTWSRQIADGQFIATDCTDCGDDIGMLIQCEQGTGQVRFSIPWLAEMAQPATPSPLSITVNGSTYRYQPEMEEQGMTGYVPAFMVDVTDPLIAALQTGGQASVTFTENTVNFGLEGSAGVLANAGEYCAPPTDNIDDGAENPAAETGQQSDDGSSHWYLSEYRDELKGDVVSLIYGIPETDATAIVADCSSAQMIVTSVVTDTGGLIAGTQSTVTITTDSNTKTYRGTVSDGSTSFPGIRVLISKDDPLWQDLANGSNLMLAPETGQEMTLSANKSEAAMEFSTRCAH